IGGDPVTISALDLQVHESRAHGTLGTALNTLRPEGRRRALSELIDVVALSEAAKAQHLDADERTRAEIESATRRILARRYVKTALEQQPSTDADLERYYRDNPDAFRAPEEIALRQLVVADQGEAERLREEVLAGADFGELAATVNEDASRARK